MTESEAMKHPDKPGVGAERRRQLSSKDEKFDVVMKEFEQGTLRDSSGKHVTDKKQALAIAYSESGKNQECEHNFEKYM